MKVLRPLWLEQPTKPRCRYHTWNMFTIACGDVDRPRSVLMTKGPANLITRFLYSIRAFLTSSFRGMILPDFPLLAESSRQMVQPISPWESLVMSQVNRATSLALRPALTDRRKMRRFLSGCLVVER